MEVSSTFILLVQAPTLTSQIYLPRVLTLIFCDHSSLLELIYCSPPVISLELLHFCVFSLDPPCLIRFYLNFSPERPLVLHSPSSLHADIRPPFYRHSTTGFWHWILRAPFTTSHHAFSLGWIFSLGGVIPIPTSPSPEEHKGLKGSISSSSVILENVFTLLLWLNNDLIPRYFLSFFFSSILYLG